MYGDNMESFELTFFVPQKLKINSCISEMKSVMNQFMGAELHTEVQIFEHEENDFLEIEFSIYDFNITKESFHFIIRKLTHFVEFVFDLLDSAAIATGIYELTYYYTEQINRLSDFNENTLRNFPLYFLRKTEVNRGNTTHIIYESDKIACFFNENAQQIVQTDNIP